jgi:GT2 family glycosyltransferase
VPDLSIVIPVYNNWWMTARLLRELDRLRAATSVDFETIVVDNASTDETPKAIAAFPWVRYAREETNRNFAGACNAGARLAQAPLTFFLNNDAYPLGDALAPLVRALEDEEVAIAGGALFFEDGVTQAAGFVVLANAHWHFSQRNLPASLPGVTASRAAIAVSGAAMAVRTAWYLDAGGFDEAYANGFEDVDLCMRARERGRTIAYVADARFAHYEGATQGRFDREAANERRFYDRWSSRFGTIERIARGSVGSIAVQAPAAGSPLLDAGLEDIEAALRSFGHPVVRGAVPAWRFLDERFRRGASLGWFAGDVRAPGVAIDRCNGDVPQMRTRGVVELSVPWLPCAAADRVERLPLRHSSDPACTTVAIAGFDAASPQRRTEVVAALDALRVQEPRMRELFLSPTFAAPGAPVDVACVLHAGLTDPSAFGNVLLAIAGLPAVAFADAELCAIFAPDVAVLAAGPQVAAEIGAFLREPERRARFGALVAADARRRFSPRRSAIRTVDLLCAARFGLERPTPARSDTPLRA